MNARRLFAGQNSLARMVAAALVCAIGARIVAPGLNAQVLADFFRSGGAGPLLKLYDWLVGGAVARGALLALGVMPYVAARIYLRVAATVVPRASELARRKGTARGVTLGLALVQSYGFARFAEWLPGAVAHPGVQFTATTMLVLTASAMSAMWLCEGPAASEDGLRGDADKANAPPIAVEQSSGGLPLLSVPAPVAEIVQPQRPIVVNHS